ncbi:DNA methyltransferase [Modestobacter sp. URMC 112]
MTRLYDSPLPATRSGPLYNAFSYPTKIDAEAVAVFLAAHTRPGDTVLDPFGGSGSTGIAARLCDRPTLRMRELAAQAGVEAAWGPRSALLYELSPIGALVARVMCTPPDPVEFQPAAEQLIADVEADVGAYYQATSPEGLDGQIRHVVWSEVLLPTCCGRRVTLWDGAVRRDPAVIRGSFPCPHCGSEISAAETPRSLVEVVDPVTGSTTLQRERVPAQIYGRSGRLTWSRPPTTDDERLLDRIAADPVPWVPQQNVIRGDLYRSGYHTGIDQIHQLYTPRNLRVMAALWARLAGQPAHLRDALELLVLSYNASHSTLLTRVVAKKQQPELVVTGAQSGVLYVSGLPVEKNILAGLRRKVRTFRDAFALTAGSRSSVTVQCASSTQLDVADQSVDYVFTDPPFGDFIPYSEVNQINEAWLQTSTDPAEEAIVSPAQGKGVPEYAVLMKQVFGEVRRVLRPEGRATVIFHASKPTVWQAIGDAFQDNGLVVERTSILDKRQVSFKQVVSQGGTRGDAVFLLRPSDARAVEGSAGPVEPQLLEDRIRALIALAENDAEGRPHRLYSRYVAACMQDGAPVAVHARDFYAILERIDTNLPTHDGALA